MKNLITMLAALAVSVSFATAADAEKKGEKKGGAQASPEERFKKMDTDGDGKLSADELKASPQGKKDPSKTEAMLKAKDKDGDGKLSLEEFSAGGKKAGKGEEGGAKKGEAK